MHLKSAHRKDGYSLQMTVFWSRSLFGALYTRNTNTNPPPHAVVRVRAFATWCCRSGPETRLSTRHQGSENLSVFNLLLYNIHKPNFMNHLAPFTFSAHILPCAGSNCINPSASSKHVQGLLSMNPSASSTISLIDFWPTIRKLKIERWHHKGPTVSTYHNSLPSPMFFVVISPNNVCNYPTSRGSVQSALPLKIAGLGFKGSISLLRKKRPNKGFYHI